MQEVRMSGRTPSDDLCHARSNVVRGLGALAIPHARSWKETIITDVSFYSILYCTHCMPVPVVSSTTRSPDFRQNVGNRTAVFDRRTRVDRSRECPSDDVASS